MREAATGLAQRGMGRRGPDDAGARPLHLGRRLPARRVGGRRRPGAALRARARGGSLSRPGRPRRPRAPHRRGRPPRRGAGAGVGQRPLPRPRPLPPPRGRGGGLPGASCSRPTCSGRRWSGRRWPPSDRSSCRASTTRATPGCASSAAASPRWRAAWYLSQPEHDLAVQLGLDPGQGDLTGAGVPVPDGLPARRLPGAARAAPARSCSTPGAARRARAGPCSSGPSPPPSPVAPTSTSSPWGSVRSTLRPAIADRVHDLGFLPDDEAADAFAAAAAYVQPSRNESFSRTVMEAWLAGTPVLANAESAVVRWHCERSGAGVTWTGEDELSAAIEALAVSPAAFEALAEPGSRLRAGALHVGPGARPHGSEPGDHARRRPRALADRRPLPAGAGTGRGRGGRVRGRAPGRGRHRPRRVAATDAPPTSTLALEGLSGIRAVWRIARGRAGRRAVAARRARDPAAPHRRPPPRPRGAGRAWRCCCGGSTQRVLDVGDVGLLPGGRAGRPVLAAATRFVVRPPQGRRRPHRQRRRAENGSSWSQPGSPTTPRRPARRRRLGPEPELPGSPPRCATSPAPAKRIEAAVRSSSRASCRAAAVDADRRPAEPASHGL